MSWGMRERGAHRKMERVMGIEPTLEAWEAAVLPLNYTRRITLLLNIIIASDPVTKDNVYNLPPWKSH